MFVPRQRKRAADDVRVLNKSIYRRTSRRVWGSGCCIGVCHCVTEWLGSSKTGRWCNVSQRNMTVWWVGRSVYQGAHVGVFCVQGPWYLFNHLLYLESSRNRFHVWRCCNVIAAPGIFHPVIWMFAMLQWNCFHGPVSLRQKRCGRNVTEIIVNF